MMLDGAIRDGCTHAAWALYLLWKARQGSLPLSTFRVTRTPWPNS